MRGVTNVITTSALLLITVALLAIILPWAWNMAVETVSALSGSAQAQRNVLLADVYFYLPPAINPNEVNQLVFVLNSGYIPLTEVRLRMIDTNLEPTDLNFFVLRRDGTLVNYDALRTSVPVLYPGDLVVGFVPAKSSYIGYRFLLQSREYSEMVEVGG